MINPLEEMINRAVALKDLLKAVRSVVSNFPDGEIEYLVVKGRNCKKSQCGSLNAQSLRDALREFSK